MPFSRHPDKLLELAKDAWDFRVARRFQLALHHLERSHSPHADRLIAGGREGLWAPSGCCPVAVACACCGPRFRAPAAVFSRTSRELVFSVSPRRRPHPPWCAPAPVLSGGRRRGATSALPRPFLTTAGCRSHRIPCAPGQQGTGLARLAFRRRTIAAPAAQQQSC